MELGIEIIFIGFLVGWLVGMTGVGGASLLTPILIFMGIQPTIAIGTDFVYNSITKAFGSIQHIKQKTVDFGIVKYMAFGSLPAAIIANILFYMFFAGYYKEDLVTTLLGYLLIIISIITLIHIFFNPGKRNPWKNKSLEDKRFITIIAGVIIGGIVGITSIGSGSLFALYILYFYNINSSKLVGTDVAHAFLLTSVTGILMSGFGHVDYSLVLYLLCGSIPGAIIGSKLTLKIPSNYIRIFIVVIILLSGIKLVF